MEPDRKMMSPTESIIRGIIGRNTLEQTVRTGESEK